MAGGQDKFAMDRAEYNRMRKEIERLRADVKLLSVAAQRADNIEKHRDELRAALEQIVAIDDNYHSSLAIHKALEIAREALDKLREVP